MQTVSDLLFGRELMAASAFVAANGADGVFQRANSTEAGETFAL